jgi:transposase-like protein
MNAYQRYRFPPDIISYAVWLYYRFNLSHRDIEDLLAERGITVSREAIRLWCIKFGAIYTQRLKRNHREYGDSFFIDEVFVKIIRLYKQYYYVFCDIFWYIFVNCATVAVPWLLSTAGMCDIIHRTR